MKHSSMWTVPSAFPRGQSAGKSQGSAVGNRDDSILNRKDLSRRIWALSDLRGKLEKEAAG